MRSHLTEPFFVCAKITLMVVHILYTKDSPHEREAQRYCEELQKRQVEARLVEADGQEGAALTELYDVLGRPAVILVRSDGSLVERWQLEWPLLGDVSYLAHQ
jgi:CRISPR/Cas system-associated endonuclease Cas1